ncbi:unnamed protein product [Citrullus colocynthis]|uniref:Uncharacterized protein n=1 Tax=Citrullus colocynthis TaxID=252529 RepID=A0ABP0XSF3_9ROSI
MNLVSLGHIMYPRHDTNSRGPRQKGWLGQNPNQPARPMPSPLYHAFSVECSPRRKDGLALEEKITSGDLEENPNEEGFSQLRLFVFLFVMKKEKVDEIAIERTKTQMK